MSNFSNAKRIFNDRSTKNVFISLDSSVTLQQRLTDNIENQPFPIILIHGKPGVGKTFLLQHTFNNLKKKHPILFYKIPFQTIQDFINHIHENFMDSLPSIDHSFDKQLEYILKNLKHDHITIMIDEVQMYDKKTLEFIRLLSDTRRFRFILAMHQVDQEDVVAKEYFTSRIWETIQMENLTPKETQMYIQKRLNHYNLHDLASKFNKKSYNRIFGITKGNFRNINKVLYKMFDIYEYFYNHQPSKLDLSSIESKYMEMAALDLGLLRA